MDLKARILEDLKIAMKEKNTSKLEAVRAMKAAIDKFEKENLSTAEAGQSMSIANYVKALKPLVKQREDSISQFNLAGNKELADKELAELTVINSYLVDIMPVQLSKDEMETIAKNLVTEQSLSKSDMGKIMSHFKTNYDGRYDGKELSIVAKTVLS